MRGRLRMRTHVHSRFLLSVLPYVVFTGLGTLVAGLLQLFRKN